MLSDDTTTTGYESLIPTPGDALVEEVDAMLRLMHEFVEHVCVASLPLPRSDDAEAEHRDERTPYVADEEDGYTSDELTNDDVYDRELEFEILERVAAAKQVTELMKNGVPTG